MDSVYFSGGSGAKKFISENFFVLKIWMHFTAL